jgi:beta-glucosidase
MSQKYDSHLDVSGDRCPKHFTGYSETAFGRDTSEAEMSHRKMKTFFLPPFEEVVKQHLMSAHRPVDSAPASVRRL